MDKLHLLPRHNLGANVVHSAKAEAERQAFKLVGSDMRQVREDRG